jgi:3-hydroxyisobutyrate dehydrogenase-like beta-hydroxyacid dehydrogenase
MQTVGFIGVGKMGGPVARLIQKAGFPMVIHDLREEEASDFIRDGAEFVHSGAEVASRSDVTFTALPMPRDIEAVAVGPQGVLDGIKPDGVYIDISTSSPLLVRRLESSFREKGAWMLDAPVGAGQPGAAEGVHEVMVGGEKSIFDRVRPVFEAYGDQIIYTGEIGSASICKLMHQLIGTGISRIVAEGLTLGAKAGVEPRIVWDCVRRGLVGRMHLMHDAIPRTVFVGKHEPALFSLNLLNKDVGLALDLARDVDVPVPMAELAAAGLAEAMSRGWQDSSGYTVTFKLQEEAAGVSLQVDGVDPDESSRYITTHGDLHPT